MLNLFSLVYNSLRVSVCPTEQQRSKFKLSRCGSAQLWRLLSRWCGTGGHHCTCVPHLSAVRVATQGAKLQLHDERGRSEAPQLLDLVRVGRGDPAAPGQRRAGGAGRGNTARAGEAGLRGVAVGTTGLPVPLLTCRWQRREGWRGRRGAPPAPGQGQRRRMLTGATGKGQLHLNCVARDWRLGLPGVGALPLGRSAQMMHEDAHAAIQTGFNRIWEEWGV